MNFAWSPSVVADVLKWIGFEKLFSTNSTLCMDEIGSKTNETETRQAATQTQHNITSA